MTIEADVARHYSHSALADAIESGLAAIGRGRDAPLSCADLSPVDEFHMGGAQATVELASKLAVAPGSRVLDIGSGLGGPARFLASTRGCDVTGIDLTPDYVAVAEMLTRRTGLSEKVRFRVASALDLPFADESFDAATQIHVGMNIADKDRLFAEVHRVLIPGGIYVVYDVMRTGDGELAFPTPWAATPATSFVETPGAYRRRLTEAGFEVGPEIARTALALDVFARLLARVAESGPPPLGLHLLMGKDTPAKVANVVAALQAGAIAPVELTARKGSRRSG